jgi:hypothetical protein
LFRLFNNEGHTNFAIFAVVLLLVITLPFVLLATHQRQELRQYAYYYCLPDGSSCNPTGLGGLLCCNLNCTSSGKCEGLMSPGPSPTPLFPPGHPDVYDLAVILLYYLRPYDTFYAPLDAKINMLDTAYVIYKIISTNIK